MLQKRLGEMGISWSQIPQSWTETFSSNCHGKRHFPVFLCLAKPASKQTESFSIFPSPHASSSQMKKGNAVTFIKPKVSIRFPEWCQTTHPPQRQENSSARP